MRSHFRTMSSAAKALSRALSFIFVVFAAFGAEFYVSPYGSAYGDGSRAKPWDLQTALNHPTNVRPGDTIWLLGGIYKGNYKSKLLGTLSAPIKVRQAQGERAVLDSQGLTNSAILMIEGGGYTWYQDFEVANSNPLRVNTTTGSNPVDARDHCINIRSPYTKVINVVVHDGAGGIGTNYLASNSEVYGALIYNNGWVSLDRMHGHGMYLQNQTGTQLFENNIILQNFGLGTQAYGSSAAHLNNFTFESNVIQDQFLVGGEGPANNITFSNNLAFRSSPQFGSSSPNNANLTIVGNYLPFGCEIKMWKGAVISGNIFSNDGTGINDLGIITGTTTTLADYLIDKNTHVEGGFYPYGVGYTRQPSGSKGYDLTGWRGLGFDLNGSVATTGKRRPTGVVSFLRPNKYDQNRSTLTIYNWDALPSVQVSLASAGFSLGDEYEIVNAYDYYGRTIKGIYSGSTINVPMTGWDVAKPIGYDQLLAPSPFPTFGVFIIRRQAAAVTVKVEAEAEAGTIVSPMVSYSYSPASGRKIVYSRQAEAGTVDIPLDIPRDGTYTIWCRVLANGASRNSFYVSADGGPEDVFDAAEGAYSTVLQWVQLNGRGGTTTPLRLNPRTLTWKAGRHILRFRGREANTILDKVIVSNDPGFRPN